MHNSLKERDQEKKKGEQRREKRRAEGKTSIMGDRRGQTRYQY